MIMKRYFIVLFSLLLAMNTTAQEKQLTAQDLIPGGKNAYRFVPQSQLHLSSRRYFADNPSREQKTYTLAHARRIE